MYRKGLTRSNLKNITSRYSNESIIKMSNNNIEELKIEGESP